MATLAKPRAETNGRAPRPFWAALALSLGLACLAAVAFAQTQAAPETAPKAGETAQPVQPVQSGAPQPSALDQAEASARRGEHKTALAAYLALAKDNNAQAQLKAGLMLDEGLGAPKDCAAAGEWLKKAAEQGLAQAQNAMGDRSRFGRCAVKSYKEAMRWYLKAAYQNNSMAMRNLASMFNSYSLGGRGGKIAAYFWAVLAAKADPEAADLRDRIMAALLPFQVEQVQAKAAEWVPGKESEAIDDLQQKKTGTGFVVGVKGYVLTNAHVVRGFKFLKGEMSGKEYALTPVKIDDEADLALLKMDAAGADGLRLRAGPGPRPGEPVVAIGFPLRGLLSLDPTVTTGAISALSGIKNDKRFLQFTAPVQPGNSGGPLLDQSGNVIGVVTLKLNALAVADVTGDIPQNVNFALTLEQIRPFLESGGAGALSAPSAATLKASEIFERSLNKVMCITASNEESDRKSKSGPSPKDVMPEGG
ncbi:MAG: trypsin-like peptidase domain-containing protein [Desulfovibrionaceae bacterium]|nr:trypsin-like peptidase domain-containing protein [Desulfovibrionaceae bacterium]MBF0512884.1 trypsin-like peptidase domain-containing protein [Desulfovibrionaceae bacterium]